MLISHAINNSFSRKCLKLQLRKKLHYTYIFNEKLCMRKVTEKKNFTSTIYFLIYLCACWRPNQYFSLSGLFTAKKKYTH